MRWSTSSKWNWRRRLDLRTLRGISASPGLVVAPARVWHRSALRIDWRTGPQGDPAHERSRLSRALELTRAELESLRGQLQERLGSANAKILDAQILILEDEDFLRVVESGIDRQHLSAELAFTRAMAEALIPLDLSGDGLFRERMTDFRDVEQRVVRALTGGDNAVPVLTEPCILVSSQLSPSETAALELEFVRGFCIDEGGRTGHTAIIARSLGVPAVVGLRDASREIRNEETIAIDGAGGRVYVEPDAEILRRFDVRMRRRRQTEERLLKLRDVPAKTRDGRVVELSANIELPQEIDVALANGARGVGLVRTEYFYLSASRLPSEDEQLASYRDLLRRVGDDPIIFRALDVGGDKLIAAMGGAREYNPFLGLRGARFLLHNPEILHTQLRAFYRASAFGRVKIMFPMVCDLEELRAFQREAAAVRSVLQREGETFDPAVELGIMIETPSAVALAPELARECDFFSIGTNDLTQYILAVDRTNTAVAHLARPEHPAVLRAIRSTIEAAHAAGIWVGCCGEMGANPLHALLLVGLGIDELSTHAAAIPMVKKAIRSVSSRRVRQWADDAVAMATVEEVDRYLRARATERLREFLGSEENEHDDAQQPEGNGT